jgi:hypothetical protein
MLNPSIEQSNDSSGLKTAKTQCHRRDLSLWNCRKEQMKASSWRGRKEFEIFSLYFSVDFYALDPDG